MGWQSKTTIAVAPSSSFQCLEVAAKCKQPSYHLPEWYCKSLLVDAPRSHGRGPCALCGEITSLICTRCKQIYVCCKEHQVRLWKSGHKEDCGCIVDASLVLDPGVIPQWLLRCGGLILKDWLVIHPGSRLMLRKPTRRDINRDPNVNLDAWLRMKHCPVCMSSSEDTLLLANGFPLGMVTFLKPAEVIIFAQSCQASHFVAHDLIRREEVVLAEAIPAWFKTEEAGNEIEEDAGEDAWCTKQKLMYRISMRKKTLIFGLPENVPTDKDSCRDDYISTCGPKCSITDDYSSQLGPLGFSLLGGYDPSDVHDLDGMWRLMWALKPEDVPAALAKLSSIPPGRLEADGSAPLVAVLMKAASHGDGLIALHTD